MMKNRFTIPLAVVAAAVLLFATTSGGFLIINDPRPSDVLVVLAGETDRRPTRALELLSEKYAPRVLLDVPAEAKIYNVSLLDIAQDYVRQLPQKNAVTICPIHGLSTRAEARDAARCLASWNVHTILVVTSDYHTRRALSIFRHQFRTQTVSVAAAPNAEEFGAHWWQHRQWAKINLNEWVRLVWWEAVDRWH
jgi:hypothetical protein